MSARGGSTEKVSPTVVSAAYSTAAAIVVPTWMWSSAFSVQNTRTRPSASSRAMSPLAGDFASLRVLPLSDSNGVDLNRSVQI